MHLILCRNVLIYLDPEAIARVAARLLASLADDGWLFLAASDPPLGDFVPCRAVRTGAGIAYRRTEGERLASPVDGVPQAPPASPLAAEALAGDASPSDEIALARAAEAEGAAGRPLEVWMAWVRALANSGRTHEANAVCMRALEEHPLVAELFYLHSVLLAGSGRYLDAAAAARRALYLDRSLIVAHLALGRALAREGDGAGARRAFRNADRLLGKLPQDEPVPAADGETPARLRRYLRVQLRLLGEAA